MNDEAFQPDPGVTQHPAWARLDDQLRYYSRSSRRCHLRYKLIKGGEILLGVAIPLLVYHDLKLLTAASGAVIAAAEAFLHLNQYATLWIEYRATAERLKREKWLFLARAGAYRELTDADALVQLAEQVEQHLSGEHDKWLDDLRQAAREVPKTKAG
jgi:hypothetical protein